MVGYLILPGAVMVPVQFYDAQRGPVHDRGHPHRLSRPAAAFAMSGPLLQQVVPYRLRGIGTALGTLYIFVVGALGGALPLGAAGR
ncbi:MAG: hypothetical protein V9F03_10555 [Microthrixaceae bacterium]